MTNFMSIVGIFLLAVVLLFFHFSKETDYRDFVVKEKDILEIDFPNDCMCLYYGNHDGERINVFREMIFFSPQEIIVSNQWRQPFPPSSGFDSFDLNFYNKKIKNKKYKIHLKDTVMRSYYEMNKGNGLNIQMHIMETKKGFYVRIIIIKVWRNSQGASLGSLRLGVPFGAAAHEDMDLQGAFSLYALTANSKRMRM